MRPRGANRLDLGLLFEGGQDLGAVSATIPADVCDPSPERSTFAEIWVKTSRGETACTVPPAAPGCDRSLEALGRDRFRLERSYATVTRSDAAAASWSARHGPLRASR